MSQQWSKVVLAAALLVPAGAQAQVTPIQAPTISCAGLPGLPGVPDIDIGTAAVATAPFVWVRVNNEVCFDLSQFIVGTGKTFGLSVSNVSLGSLALVQSLTGAFDTDPFASLGIATQNLLPGTVNYDWMFGTPVVPIPYSEAQSQVEVAMVPGIGPTSVDVGNYPTYVSGYSNLFATNHNVDLGNTPCIAGVNSPCDYGMASNTFPPTVYADLEGLLSYSQTGELGIASWAARVDLLPAQVVPEPATVVLVAGGLLVLGGVTARRRRD